MEWLKGLRASSVWGMMAIALTLALVALTRFIGGEATGGVNILIFAVLVGIIAALIGRVDVLERRVEWEREAGRAELVAATRPTHRADLTVELPLRDARPRNL